MLEIFFFKNHVKNESGGLVPDLTKNKWLAFNFDFLKKGLKLVSPEHFTYDFPRKMFLMLYYIN